MILFHGTIFENIKSIKKKGLLDSTQDQWLVEVLDTKVCCVSNEPTSGEGGNAAYFAYGNPKIKNQDGYLTVIELPVHVFEEKLVTIFDNKILDDYVRFHFFVRQEFRDIGYTLYQAFTYYRNCDHNFIKLDKQIKKRSGKEKDSILYDPDDQHLYYKKLMDHNDRYIYDICGVEVTDELYSTLHHIGVDWATVYEFLKIHFGSISQEEYQNFVDQFAKSNHAKFWSNFYKRFPVKPDDLRRQVWSNWFSPKWLKQRQTKEVTPNCQILMSSIEPEYILDFIKITTPSGFAGPFRSCRSKSGFSQKVWKIVHGLRK